MTLTPLIRKIPYIRLDSFMIQLYVIYNAPVSNFAMPHIQITSFSSFKYTEFNMGCHAGHFYRRNQGNLLSSDSSAMKKIDDIRSEPFVMPNVQHTRYFHY